MFFALPAAVSLMFIPDLVIKSLFGYGAFTLSDVKYTADALKVYALGIPAFVLIKILGPFYFARQDIRTPLVVAAFSALLNVLLTWFFIKKIGFVGIALSLVVTGWINVVILFVI